MAFWNIGPIRGQYQPESFEEKQVTETGDHYSVGGVQQFQFKHWSAREITISFVVDYYDSAGLTGVDADDCDPEAVWEKIQELQRPKGAIFPKLVPVLIPGWGGADANNQKFDTAGWYATNPDGETVNIKGGSTRNGGRPTVAVIISSSISRTHIRWQKSQASRATITLTLREYAAGRPIGFAYEK